MNLDGDPFLDAVNHPDPLTRFVRLHQFFDSILTALINELLVESHHLDVERVPFALRVELAVAMGVVESEDRPALLQFNGIRNRLVHDPQTALTEKDVRDFYNICGTRLRAMLNDQERDDVGFISAVLFIKLECQLNRARDQKLWERATLDEFSAVHDRMRSKFGFSNSHSPSGERIRARFEALKALQQTTPGPDAPA